MTLLRELSIKSIQVAAALVVVACLVVIFGVTSLFGRMSNGH